MRSPSTNVAGRALACLQGGLLAALVTASGAWADDTEVFFGQVDLTANNRPNVLFILDTSGSMNRYSAPATEPRITRLKRAMEEIIDSSTDINIGLMRFNGGFGGGSIIEPIRPIDTVVCASAYCGETQTRSQVSGVYGDTEQRVSDGHIMPNGYTLTMGQVGAEAGEEQIVGLSFAGLDIPQGATIVSAKIEFVADQSDSAATTLSIAVEASDDASPFTDTDADLSGRTTTGASVPWVPEAWTLNSAYESPDIKDLVQSITDRSGWCAKNALNVLVAGAGDRSAMSTRRDPGSAPTLKVTYDASELSPGSSCIRESTVVDIAANTDDAEQLYPNNGTTRTDYTYASVPRWQERSDDRYDTVVGLRFDKLDVPRGATIEEAYLTMSAYRASSATSAEVRIEVQDSDDAPTFSGGQWTLSNLPTTSGHALWDIPAIGASGETMTSEDVSTLVQSIVNRTGWEEDNAIAFLFTPESGRGVREFHNREGSGTAPKLHVTYRTTIPSGSQRTVRDALKLAVSNIQATGNTPITGALYEGTQYMLGGPVDYGRQRGFNGDVWKEYDGFEGDGSHDFTGRFAEEAQPGSTWLNTGNDDDRSRYHRTSHPLSWTGGTLDTDCPADDPSHPDCRTESITGDPVYLSPMLDTCQTNHVVLLSDGRPYGSGGARRAQELTGTSCFGVGNVEEQCGAELASWMKNTDHNPRVAGTQGITTYTVGFDLAGNASATAFLKSLSREGGGKHFEASQTAELVDSFNQIINSVTAVDTAFVSPGATVNQFNRLTHRNDIYFALFKPSESASWDGNLKRYKVVDDGDRIVIKDVNGNDAVNEEIGFFADNAQSFWTSEADGPNVKLGGFAQSLSLGDGDDDTRKVYTYTGSGAITTAVDLTASEHALSETNDDITHAMLGTTGQPDAYKETLLSWARGVDVKDADGDNDTTDVRAQIGDPMHSQPVIVNYGSTPADNETTVFVSTNEGFLHALDPEVTSGSDVADTAIGVRELYSWIPQELLANLDDYYEDRTTSTHLYGLDGHISAWIDDRDNDLTVDPNESAYLFLGMRRGGDRYYALDISDRESPKLAWVIDGGLDGSTGFERLGQSWSRAIPTRIQINGAAKNVVVFTGGYDTNQDPGEVDRDPSSPRYGKVPSRTTDSQGQGLYIVEIETGDLLWSGLGTAGGTQRFDDMNYSMPASPELVDVDLDGFVDQIYLSDTGGQIWRFDVKSYHESDDGDLMSGGIMARLGSSDDDEQRRFYYEPDVSLVEHDGARFVSIAIGSGWRAHPLNEMVEDRFYVLRTPAIYAKPAGYGRFDDTTSTWTPITDADLVDADDLSSTVSVSGHGWYKELDTDGEKVLSSSLTINNQVAFTTYLPAQKVAVCTAAIGSGAVYVLDLVTGRPTADLDGDGKVDTSTVSDDDDSRLDSADDKRILAHPGIPPGIVAIITENNEGTLIGTEQQDLDFGLMTRRTYWSDLSDTPDNADLDDLVPAAAEPEGGGTGDGGEVSGLEGDAAQ